MTVPPEGGKWFGDSAIKWTTNIWIIHSFLFETGFGGKELHGGCRAGERVGAEEQGGRARTLDPIRHGFAQHPERFSWSACPMVFALRTQSNPTEWPHPIWPIRPYPALFFLLVLQFDTIMKHAETLDQIRGLNGSLAWRRMEALLRSLGAEVHEGYGSTTTFVLRHRKLTVDRPHSRKECGRGLVKRLRSFLDVLELLQSPSEEGEEG